MRDPGHLAACDACTRYREQACGSVELLDTVPCGRLCPEAQPTLPDAFRD
jgi:hypothetical protein